MLKLKISLILLLIAGKSIGQVEIRKLDVKVKKHGPTFGVQRGLYTTFELGLEKQWKNIQLKSANTHAIRTAFNYDFINNIICYDLGFWTKRSRLGLTYGVNGILYSNFDKIRSGFAPVIGYKLSGLHLQTGINVLSKSKEFTNVNTFFISLRFSLLTHRDVKF
jgi:hypothetical protein